MTLTLVREVLRAASDLLKGLITLIKYAMGIRPSEPPEWSTPPPDSHHHIDCDEYLNQTLYMMEHLTSVYLLDEGVRFESFDGGEVEFSWEIVEAMSMTMAPEEAANYIQAQLNQAMN